MVIGVIDSLIELSNAIFSNIIKLPEQLTQPILSHIYVEYAFLGIFFLAIVLSRFIGFKKTFFMLIAVAVLGFLVGGLYFATVAMVAQIPFILVMKFAKRGEGGGEGDLGDIGGGKEEDFGDLGKEMGGKEEGGEDLGLGDLGKGPPELGKEPELPGGEEELGLPKEEPEPALTTELGPSTTPAQPLQPAQPPQKTCPYCSQSLSYIQQYGRYYCYRCRRYL
jgi:hypothetical protein